MLVASPQPVARPLEFRRSQVGDPTQLLSVSFRCGHLQNPTQHNLALMLAQLFSLCQAVSVILFGVSLAERISNARCDTILGDGCVEHCRGRLQAVGGQEADWLQLW